MAPRDLRPLRNVERVAALLREIREPRAGVPVGGPGTGGGSRSITRLGRVRRRPDGGRRAPGDAARGGGASRALPPASSGDRGPRGGVRLRRAVRRAGAGASLSAPPLL